MWLDPVAARRLVFGLGAGASLFLCTTAEAGRLLDSIRAADLNDYALGFVLHAAESPYVGSGTSTNVYPYLTSFRHAAFTDDWLMARNENIGTRFVVAEDWEIGVVGRVQTLGRGISNSSSLDGLDERNWTVEMSPLLGWRRWPVHLQFRSYWEIPDRHSGNTSELEASLPLSFSRGYFVPSVRVVRMSDDYANFYFGVRDSEATTVRPAYSPGAVTNLRIGFDLGYAVSPRWLFRTSASVTILDEDVSGSPIVDKGRTWALSVGAAYNADLFQPRAHDTGMTRRPLEVRTAFFQGGLQTEARAVGANGQSGDTVLFERDLGLSRASNNLQLDIRYRIGFFHRLELSLVGTEREGKSVQPSGFRFGDEVFDAGTEVTSSMTTRRIRLAYAYSLVRDNQKEFGVSLGIVQTGFEVQLYAQGTSQRERVSVDTPLPTAGLFGSLAFESNWSAFAEAGIFALDFDRYSGYSGYFNLGFERSISELLSVGAGYNYYLTRLESETSELTGLVKARNRGPTAYITWRF